MSWRQPFRSWARQRDLQNRHFLEGWDFYRAYLERGYAWQQEDFAFKGMQMQQSRTWGLADFAWNRQMSERQFGWQMEDLDENIRFAQKQRGKTVRLVHPNAAMA